MVAAFTKKCWVSDGFLRVLVPDMTTVYVSMVAFFGIFQLAVTIPAEDAGAVCEKTRVDVACVRMVTVTLSDALYPLAWTLRVWVLSRSEKSTMLMKKELEATPENGTGLTKSTVAMYWPSREVDPGNNTLGYTTRILNWDWPRRVV
jgi:hypothetical protein